MSHILPRTHSLNHPVQIMGSNDDLINVWTFQIRVQIMILSQFFMSSFCVWCKSPGPIKDTDMIMKIRTDCDNNKYILLLVWTNIEFIEIYCVCHRHIQFNLFHGSRIILLDTCTLFPKVLPPKGDIVREIPAFKIQRRSINTTINLTVQLEEKDKEFFILGCFIHLPQVWTRMPLLHFGRVQNHKKIRCRPQVRNGLWFERRLKCVAVLVQLYAFSGMPNIFPCW